MSLIQEKINTLKKLTALKGEKNLSIESVVDSFAALEAKKLDILPITSRSGQGTLMPREDRVMASSTSSDALLQCSPQKIAGHQIALSSIMHGE